MAIDAKTKVYCVIGNPVEHSLSPAIHNAAFQKLGLNCVYVAFPVKDVGLAVKGMKALDISGASVTIPHKVKIIEYLDQVDDIASNIGAVNTVVNDGAVLKGYNSDGLGALRALQVAAVNLTGKRILVLGSGGAARSIVFTIAMQENPEQIYILGVEEEELNKLLEDIRKRIKINVMGKLLDNNIIKKMIDDSDVLIHCTPIGMYPKVDISLVPSEMLRKELVVFDIVYNPLNTELLSAAKAAGCQIIRGIEMFVNQAVVQFELWTGEKAPVALMQKVLEDSLRR